ncbi:hypothetical protein V6N12_053367 [Hibiscus sabdariffa]|uniref:Uncharacterized protein n=1 Tax=Hibiscus sabdariffa TaxID=183260 RepID=A0ABR2D849_9ROSI
MSLKRHIGAVGPLFTSCCLINFLLRKLPSSWVLLSSLQREASLGFIWNVISDWTFWFLTNICYKGL